MAEGLEVSKTGDKLVSVSPGTAIDRNGQEIVLPSDPAAEPIDFSTEFAANDKVYLTIAYQEVFDEDDHYTAGEVDDYNRTTERPTLQATTDVPPSDGSVIKLALVQLDADGNVTTPIDHSGRTLAGAGVAPETVDTAALAGGGVTVDKLDAAV